MHNRAQNFAFSLVFRNGWLMLTNWCACVINFSPWRQVQGKQLMTHFEIRIRLTCSPGYSQPMTLEQRHNLPGIFLARVSMKLKTELEILQRHEKHECEIEHQKIFWKILSIRALKPLRTLSETHSFLALEVPIILVSFPSHRHTSNIIFLSLILPPSVHS